MHFPAHLDAVHLESYTGKLYHSDQFLSPLPGFTWPGATFPYCPQTIKTVHQWLAIKSSLYFLSKLCSHYGIKFKPNSVLYHQGHRDSPNSIRAFLWWILNLFCQDDPWRLTFYQFNHITGLTKANCKIELAPLSICLGGNIVCTIYSTNILVYYELSTWAMFKINNKKLMTSKSS